jgi:hypothetical protein
MEILVCLLAIIAFIFMPFLVVIVGSILLAIVIIRFIPTLWNFVLGKYN